MIKNNIFEGDFYEAVKQAHIEKMFSDVYKPLLDAFEEAEDDWKHIEYEIINKYHTYINQNERNFEEKIVDLRKYVEGI